MLLAIDIGNTNVVCGLFNGSTLQAHWRLATESRRTDNEYGILLLNLLQNAGFTPDQITGCILSSVVPALTATFDSLVQTYFHKTPVIVGPETDSGLTLRYANPKEIGSDRIVNAAAAHARYHSDLIIVDFGTATTFCAVTKSAEYLGGVIAPGLGISADALSPVPRSYPRLKSSGPKPLSARIRSEAFRAASCSAMWD